MQATYTDGTPVQEGDRVRYRQTPGGLLSRGGWTEGVAVPYEVDTDELHVFDGKCSLPCRTAHHRAPVVRPSCVGA